MRSNLVSRYSALTFTVAILFSTAVVAQQQQQATASMSFKPGTWTGSAVECARRGMQALSDTGFKQNLTFLNGSMGAGAFTTDGHGAMVLCLPKGDSVVFSFGTGDVENLITSLAKRMNEIR